MTSHTTTRSNSNTSLPIPRGTPRGSKEDDRHKEPDAVAALRQLTLPSNSNPPAPVPRNPRPRGQSTSPLLGRFDSLPDDIREFANKENEKKSASRELVRHLVFVVILIACVTLHRSAYESYLMNQALITSFVTQQIDVDLQPFAKTFMDIGQPDEFASWLTSVVGGTLDSDKFYSGKNMTEKERDYVMFNNRLLGGVRLRQLRAAPNKGCTVPPQLKGISDVCYSWGYSSGTKDRAPFGPPEDPHRYNYSTSSECGSVSIWGSYLSNLEGGGYVVDVDLASRDNGNSFTDKFQQLISDTWIDQATRAVIVTMNFLNIDLESRVAVMYLIVEIPGNGVLFPTVMIKTFRLNLYVAPLDYFRLFLELLFLVSVVYTIFAEAREMWKSYEEGSVKMYFYSGWNLMELLSIVLYLAVIILYLQYLTNPDRTKNTESRSYFPAIEQLAASALNFYNICAINVLLTTFRTFKYLRLNHRLYLLWKTLKHAGADLLGFLFIFLIFIFGFIFMAWLTFGADLEEFNSFVHAFATCWNFIIGNAPDYNAIVRSNRVLGPLFFTLFTIFIFFILTNMFIAILSNSFDTVSDDPNSNESKIRDIVEHHVKVAIRGIQKLYFRITKQKPKKRSIHQMLDDVEQPKLLESLELSRSDVARALGTATEEEVDDFFDWIKKIEGKRQKRAIRASKGVSVEMEMSSSLNSSMFLPTQTQSPVGGDEVTEILRDLQLQMKQVLEHINGNKGQ